MSNAEIAEHLQLSPAGVRNLVNDLRDAVLDQAKQGHSNGRSGRTPSLVSIRPTAGYSVGINFGEVYMAVELTDCRGERVLRAEKEHPVGREPGSSLEWMASTIREFLDQEHLGADLIIGVGIGVAAPVEHQGGQRDTATLRGEFGMRSWSGINPAAELKKILQWDVPFVLENDANLVALAEQRKGAAREIEDAIVVKWTHGIGAGLIAGGALLRGASGIAGELGHCLVELDEEHHRSPPPPCDGCAQRCLQSLASVQAIASYAGVETWDDAIGLAVAGDHTSRRAIARAARYLGKALGFLVTTLNPQAVIIGGDMKAEHYGLFSHPLQIAIREHTTAPAFEKLELLPGKTTGFATTTGAVGLVLSERLVPYLLEKSQ